MGIIKNISRKWLQELMGFEQYLFVFARFNIFRINRFKKEKAFRYFNAMIKDDGAILDIGANIGVITVCLAKMHPGSMIHAFEPIPENYQTLEKVLKFYKLTNVQVYKTALGDREDEVNMLMPVINGSKMQGLSHITDPSIKNDIQADVYTVPLLQLDKIHELQQPGKISAIKIDVENFEYYVLKGGEALLKKHRPVIFCELWNNAHREMCIELMKNMHYQTMVLEKDNLVAYTGQDALNYFFLP